MTTTPTPPGVTGDAEERTSDLPDAPRGDASDRGRHGSGASVDLPALGRYVDWGLKLVSLAVIPLFVWIWQHDRSDVATVQRLETAERDMQALQSDLKDLESSVEACREWQAGILVIENELGHLQAGIEDVKVQIERLYGSSSP